MTMKRLGKGLAQIMEQGTPLSPNVVMVRTEQVKPSRYQSRQQFDPASLEELFLEHTRTGGGR